MAPAVTALFTHAQDLYHASLLYTGLHALSRRGAIALRLRRARSADDRALAADPLAVCLEVADGGAVRRVAVDLRDQSDRFAAEPLARCDAYLKRSFHRPDLAALPADAAARVRPFGLNFACRTLGATVRLLAAVGPAAAGGAAGRRHLRTLLVLPTTADFEQRPDAELEPAVVFQTRVWEPADAPPGESEAINAERVAVVRALREALGDRFRGGLVPTPLALARYPREVTAHPSRRRRYTLLSKRHLIGVYTRGLHQSTAFKLPEYLAAAQCVVAEPPRNELPAPLEPGRHYLPFRTPDECVTACQRLLRDADLARAMRQANADYYRSEVEPAARASRVVGPAGSHPPGVSSNA